MTVKQFLILMAVCTVFCAGAWLLVLFYLNPETTGILGFSLFYLSLFFTIVGLLSLLGFFARYLFTRNFPQFEQAHMAFRQALLFGIVVVLSFFLQAQELLSWLNALLLVLLLSIFEFLIVSLRKT